jgi:hypothetical protein
VLLINIENIKEFRIVLMKRKDNPVILKVVK